MHLLSNDGRTDTINYVSDLISTVNLFTKPISTDLLCQTLFFYTLQSRPHPPKRKNQSIVYFFRCCCLHIAVQMRRYGSLIKINPFGKK